MSSTKEKEYTQEEKIAIGISVSIIIILFILMCWYAYKWYVYKYKWYSVGSVYDPINYRYHIPKYVDINPDTYNAGLQMEPGPHRGIAFGH